MDQAGHCTANGSSCGLYKEQRQHDSALSNLPKQIHKSLGLYHASLDAPLALRRIPTTLRAIARLTIKGWFGPTPARWTYVLESAREDKLFAFIASLGLQRLKS
eukprot:4826952-Amphidinium_carterae.1